MSDEQKLTHIDEKGDVRMVDVSAKPDTERIAVAEGFISMHQETLDLIVEGKATQAKVPATEAAPPLRIDSDIGCGLTMIEACGGVMIDGSTLFIVSVLASPVAALYL